MSTFRAFQTGLEAGQNQAKVRREDDARKKATEAYGMGDYEGAVTGLMGAGLTQDASNYNTLGQQAQTRKQQQGYATALGSAPDQRTGMQNLRGAAMQAGDPETMLKVDEALKGMDADQAAKFGEGMNFLGQTALGLKGVPPEARGQAAMEILQNSPYANPQIMQQIQQAAADGKITDDELDNFAMQTMSVADRVKLQREAMPKPPEPFTLSPGQRRYNPDGTIAASVPETPKAPSAGDDTFRPATAEDRARWNLPPEGAFKINERTGEPAAISGARAAQDFSPTEIRGFRDQADGLYILQNAVNQYVTMLEKMGGPQLFDTPLNAKNTQALKSAHGLITEAIKDAGKLGALDQGVQNLVNAIIQEPVGLGTFGKSTDSIKQAANQLNSSIEFKLSRVPEEYRAGSTGAVPDFEGDDDDFIDTLFEPAPNAPAPASSRATPMATVNPGTSTGRFHKGNDPRQTQRPTAPRPQPAARQPVQSQQPPPDVDPEDWKYFTPEMKQQYLAGRGQ